MNNKPAKIVSINEISNAIDRLMADFKTGSELVGKMIADRMAIHPNTCDELAKRGHSRSLLQELYFVGLGQRDWRLLIDESPAAEHLKKLPFEQQKKLLDEGAPVGEVESSGKQVQIIKPTSVLTRKECKKVFDDNGNLRPIEEQIVLAKAEQRRIKVEPARRYEISEDGETIEVLEKTAFTLSHWIEISEEAAERQKKFLQENLQKRQIG